MPDVDTARVIKEHLAAAAMSRKELATRCKVSDKTIQRVLKGDFSEITLLRIKAALNMRCDRHQENPTTAHSAPVTRASHEQIHYQYHVGDYLCYQRYPFDTDLILVSHIAISWQDDRSCLVFREMMSACGSAVRCLSDGEIHVDCSTGHLHFLHRGRGRVRLIITCPLRLDSDNTLRGLVLSVSNLGPLAIPVAVPVVIAKQVGALSEEQLAARLGLFPAAHELLREVGAQLTETERAYASFGRAARGIDITSLPQEPSIPTLPPARLVSTAA